MGLKYTNISWKTDKEIWEQKFWQWLANPDTDHSYKVTLTQSDKKSQPLHNLFNKKLLFSTEFTTQQILFLSYAQCAKVILKNEMCIYNYWIIQFVHWNQVSLQS